MSVTRRPAGDSLCYMRSMQSIRLGMALLSHSGAARLGPVLRFELTKTVAFPLYAEKQTVPRRQLTAGYDRLRAKRARNRPRQPSS
jgi:hypothetical protein